MSKLLTVDITVPKPLPVKEMDAFMDKAVYHMARQTLDRTNPHVPYRSGDMKRDIYSYAVQGGNKTYTLGYNSVRYTPYVWAMTSSTNWTNKQSYPQWFITEFLNNKEKIVSQAVSQAKAVLR